MDQPSGDEDYYQLLQVQPSAHPQVVRAAFRTLLKTLGKHPDMGGRPLEARRIIEAYATLSDPDRRQEYDRRLKSLAAPSVTRATPPDALAGWVRAVLANFRETRTVLFADCFDGVLEGALPVGNRVFLKAFSLVNRRRWPYVFALRRAAQLARTGVLPAADVLLLLTPHVDDLPTFLDTAARSESFWDWHRCILAVCTFPPPRLHTGRVRCPPEALRRLWVARFDVAG